MSVKPPLLPPGVINDFSLKWKDLTDLVFVDGALSAKTKELIAVAAAHVTLCDFCIAVHTARAVKFGATKSEITEAIWVGIAMRTAAAVVRSRSAFSTIEKMGL